VARQGGGGESGGLAGAGLAPPLGWRRPTDLTDYRLYNKSPKLFVRLNIFLDYTFPNYFAVAYPGYPPAAQHNVTTNTTVVAQPTLIMTTTLGPMPVGMICPHCQAQIVTSTSYEPGTLAWLTCCGIALVG
jgi:hypothetical protein